MLKYKKYTLWNQWHMVGSNGIWLDPMPDESVQTRKGEKRTQKKWT